MESAPYWLKMSASEAIAALPENGRSSSSGRSAASRPTRLLTGESSDTSRSIRPLSRSVRMAMSMPAR